jgi:coenzyme F420-reducing hydrogenase delta subunit
MESGIAKDHAYIYPLFMDMIRNKINYGYRGAFTNEVSDGLILFASGLFDQSDISKKLKKRVVYIMVECVQNVTRHQEMPDEVKKSVDGIFLIQSDGELINITQGNMIQNDKIEPLSMKLDHINKLSPEELKEVYTTTLSESDLSEKGGAGLGLIDIARKSGNKILYKFSRCDDQYSLFFMDTLICDPCLPGTTKSGTFYGLDITEKLMSVLTDNNINLIYCSQFSGRYAFDLLSIIDNLRFDTDKSLLARKRLFSVLVEMLQNIFHHAAENKEVKGKTGILLMGAEGNESKIITGNLIRKEDLQTLLDHLNYLNNLDKDGLVKYFIEKLTSDDFSEPTKNGLGLVEMLMKSGNPLQYHCIPVNQDYSFISIQVTIKNPLS